MSKTNSNVKKWLVITSISLLLLAVSSFTAYLQETYTASPTVLTAQVTVPKPPPKPIVVIRAEDLHGFVNAKRVENGLAPLTLNEKLHASAVAKCNDMIAKDYWAHNSPDGQQPWHFFTEAGYKYEKAAENLSRGYMTSKGIVDGWMNSEGHRINLLSNAYNEVGYAVCKSPNFMSTGEKILTVQHLATQ